VAFINQYLFVSIYIDVLKTKNKCKMFFIDQVMFYNK